MKKIYLIIVSLLQFLLGVLGIMILVRNIMENNYNMNFVFTLLLTLFCFYFGISGFKMLIGKNNDNNDNNDDKDDKNEKSECGGGWMWKL